MSSSFWNPFRPNRYYFARPYLVCIGNFMCMLFGDGGAGLLDYPLFPWLLFIWAERKNIIPRGRRLQMFFEFSFLFFSFIKIIIIIPLTIASLPFIFLYNELFLYIGRPLNKICNELEVLPFDKYQCADKNLKSSRYDDYNKVPLNYDIFNTVFYQEAKNSARLVDIHKPHPSIPPGLVSDHIEISPLFINVTDEKKILVLALYDCYLHSFIVPSKENSALLRPLIENHVINFDHFSDEYASELLVLLNKALDEEDPFLLLSRQWRVETTVFLLKSMCPDGKSRKQQGNGVLDICSIITDYAGCSNLSKEDKLEVAQKTERDEQSLDTLNCLFQAAR